MLGPGGIQTILDIFPTMKYNFDKNAKSTMKIVWFWLDGPGKAFFKDYVWAR